MACWGQWCAGDWAVRQTVHQSSAVSRVEACDRRAWSRGACSRGTCTRGTCQWRGVRWQHVTGCRRAWRSSTSCRAVWYCGSCMGAAGGICCCPQICIRGFRCLSMHVIGSGGHGTARVHDWLHNGGSCFFVNGAACACCLFSKSTQNSPDSDLHTSQPPPPPPPPINITNVYHIALNLNPLAGSRLLVA